MAGTVSRPACEPLARHAVRWLGMVLEALCRGREPYPATEVKRRPFLEHGRLFQPDPAMQSDYQCFVRCSFDESDWARTGSIKIMLWCNTGIGIQRDVPVGMANQHRVKELIELIYQSNRQTDILLGDNRLLGALHRAHQQR
jgi:hypothetical protein